MSSTDLQYFSGLAALLSICLAAAFFIYRARAAVNWKVLLKTLLIFPSVQVIFSFVVLQTSNQGMAEWLTTGKLLCSGFHGGGLRSCDPLSALVETVIVTAIFSFITWGLLPAANFTAVLAVLATRNLRRAQKTKPHTPPPAA